MTSGIQFDINKQIKKLKYDIRKIQPTFNESIR